MSIIEGLPSAEYHARPEVSKSGLDLIAKSPAHYRAGYQSIGSDTARIGSAVHAAVLEHGRGLVDAPSWGRRSRADLDSWASWFEGHGADRDIAERPAAEHFPMFEAQTGLLALRPDERALVDAMAASVAAHVHASAFTCLPGIAEASIITELDDVPVRVRPDWMVHDSKFGPLLVDVKTTLDATGQGFRRSVANYRYQVQAALYSDAYEAETGRAPRFLFIAVEKSAPHVCAVFELDEEAMENGRYLYSRDLATWAHCTDTDTWPGPPDDFALDIPIYDADPTPLTFDGESIAA